MRSIRSLALAMLGGCLVSAGCLVGAGCQLIAGVRTDAEVRHGGAGGEVDGGGDGAAVDGGVDGGDGCSSSDDCMGGVCLNGACCTPVPAATLCDGKCGMIDNCGQAEDCGGCVEPEMCEGGGLKNVCGCPALCPLWNKRFGDDKFDSSRSIAVDSADRIVVTGDFLGTINFGDGPHQSFNKADAFVAKFTPLGGCLWSTTFIGDDNEYGKSVAVDSVGNVLVMGDFGGTFMNNGGVGQSAGESDVFITKLHESGSHIWSRFIGDAGNQTAAGLAVDSNDNVFVTGNFSGTADFGGGGVLMSVGASDVFLAKLGANGAHLWSHRIGGSFGVPVAQSVATGSGGVLVAGDFAGTADFIAGTATSKGETDVFIVKLDGGGNHTWTKQLGGAYEDHVRKVRVDSVGDVLVAGYFEGVVNFGGNDLMSAGASDVFVVKLNAAGQHIWSKRFGDANVQDVLDLTTDISDNVLLTGYVIGTMDFGGGPLVSNGSRDTFVARLAPDGSHLSSARFGDSTFQAGHGIVTDSAGDVVVTGGAAGAIDFGLGELAGVGLQDIFLVKLKPWPGN